MFWSAKTVFSLLLVMLTLGAHALDDDRDSDIVALRKAIHSYSESKALGHKASTFLHARTAYRLARRQYLKSAKELAPHAFRYAEAAATYQNPIALGLFEQTLDLYVIAYDRDHASLVLPLIAAADEASRKDEYEMAYAWYLKASKLLARDKPNGSFASAQAYMGIARLHLRSRQIEKAKLKAQKAIDFLFQYYADGSPTDIGSIMYGLGEIERASGHDTDALDAYTQALAIYSKHDASALEVFELHKRLVELNHKLKRPAQIISHCLAAQQFQYARKRSPLRDIIYDPTGRLSDSGHNKQGEFRATFRKGTDCRLHDIEIHQVNGVTRTEAKALLDQVYYAPVMMRGEIGNDEYFTLSTLAVYKK